MQNLTKILYIFLVISGKIKNFLNELNLRLFLIIKLFNNDKLDTFQKLKENIS